MSRSSPPSRSAAGLKVLLLENVHTSAHELLLDAGCRVDALPNALGEDALIERLRGVQVLGIRSKTQVTARVLAACPQLMTVGCFCIGTNQVALSTAHDLGRPVFNAPFSNTRSVAEMIIAEVVMLARQLGDRVREVHAGTWNKVSKACVEVRGKTLGIVGYGHIGSQVGILAEAMGMRVVSYDIATKLPMGNTQTLGSLEELLEVADFVTLHVPATPLTERMINGEAIARMKKGAMLLNASRGTVVDLEALSRALRDGRLGGAAIDVFPEEPEENGAGFVSVLQGAPNVILTPHIGGSTLEAQANIGREVATSLVRFIEVGSTVGAVNFPNLEMPPTAGSHRVLNAHRNVPGVLRDVNRIASDLGANIRAQMLATDASLGYLIMDLDQDVSTAVADAIGALGTNISTRVVY
jgi:D-3-phosphoglycerate dehydrogenase